MSDIVKDDIDSKVPILPYLEIDNQSLSAKKFTFASIFYYYKPLLIPLFRLSTYSLWFNMIHKLCILL